MNERNLANFCLLFMWTIVPHFRNNLNIKKKKTFIHECVFDIK